MTRLTCPVCGAKFDLQATSVPPFCSPRCRRVDLGRWLSEDYALPIDRSEEEPDEDPPEVVDGDD